MLHLSKTFCRFLASPCTISLTWVPWGYAILGLLFSLLLFFPGYTRLDAVVHYTQAVSGVYGDWHPPIIAVIWRGMRYLANGFTEGTHTGQGLFFIFQTALIWTGVLLCLRTCKKFFSSETKKTWLSLLLFLFLFGWAWIEIVYRSRILFKDNLFPACFLVAVGCFLNMPKQRWKMMIIALIAYLLLLLGTATRHNALFSTWPLLFWLLWTITPKKSVALVTACSTVLWVVSLGIISYVNYSILNTVRLYPLQERFYADIFMLNYHTGDFTLPPDTFGNTFGQIDKKTFNAYYNPDVLFVDLATDGFRKRLSIKLSLVKESVLIEPEDKSKHPFPFAENRFEDHFLKTRFDNPLSKVDNNNCVFGIIKEKDIRETYPEDYLRLRDAWIEKVSKHWKTYLWIKANFLRRFLCANHIFFFFLDGFLLLITSGMIAFVYSLSVRKWNDSKVAVCMLSWSALLYVMPLLLFLPSDVSDCVRYLYWYFTASLLAIFLMMKDSAFAQFLIQNSLKYLRKILLTFPYL
jgi:hypothetical protein